MSKLFTANFKPLGYHLQVSQCTQRFIKLIEIAKKNHFNFHISLIFGMIECWNMCIQSHNSIKLKSSGSSTHLSCDSEGNY